jgi:hypothetical protein
MKLQSSMIVSQVVKYKWPSDVGYSISRHFNKQLQKCKDCLFSSLRVGCVFTSLQWKEWCDGECSSRLTDWICVVSSQLIVLTPGVGTTNNCLAWCVWTVHSDKPVWKCWPYGLPWSASRLASNRGWPVWCRLCMRMFPNFVCFALLL